MPIYLDTSAVGKLLLDEAESPALNAFLATQPGRISSMLTRIEVHRALRRTGSGAARYQRALHVVERMFLVAIDESVIAKAAALDPPELRSLDAIHLATALSVPGLEGMVVYDRRLARAAEAAGLRVWAPGQAAL